MERLEPDLKSQFNTLSAEETLLLGRTFGTLAADRCVFALNGDLGAGKTLFVQGLARGLAVPPDTPITSPTYALIHQYDGRMPLYHVDLYRIQDSDELEEIGFEEILGLQSCVVAVEWADLLPSLGLEAHLRLEIQIVGDDRRTIDVFAYGRKIVLLLQEVQKKFSRALDASRG